MIQYGAVASVGEKLDRLSEAMQRMQAEILPDFSTEEWRKKLEEVAPGHNEHEKEQGQTRDNSVSAASTAAWTGIERRLVMLEKELGLLGMMTAAKIETLELIRQKLRSENTRLSQSASDFGRREEDRVTELEAMRKAAVEEKNVLARDLVSKIV